MPSGRKILTVVVLVIVLLLVTALYFTQAPEYLPPELPHGKKFAFAIIDDTDGATLENVEPVYDFLWDIGVISTKTVWILPTNDPDHWPNRGTSVADSQYLAFVLDLQSKGYEIALHGVRGGHSKRDEIITSLDEFNRLFGHYPKIHINHSENRDNLYWGKSKLSFFPFRMLYGLFRDNSSSSGHDPESEYFWGDIAKERIDYVTNFSFHDINMFKINPLIPYRDDSKPYVNFWFHSSDGGYVDSFNRLISKENVDRLEREGGICFVYTHLASGFYRDGRINPIFDERMRYLASKDGWFAPASEVLDYIRKKRGNDDSISFRDRIYIELRWLYEKLVYGQT